MLAMNSIKGSGELDMEIFNLVIFNVKTKTMDHIQTCIPYAYKEMLKDQHYIIIEYMVMPKGVF